MKAKVTIEMVAKDKFKALNITMEKATKARKPKRIPSFSDNPMGLHRRYIVSKVNGNPQQAPPHPRLIYEHLHR